jgi:hypothetical protein
MNTYTRRLANPFVHDILDYLEGRREAPTLVYLNRLIHAFIRKVPWESVSRIIKRNVTSDTAECPRWPKEVWSDAMAYNGGGTCFEINYAFLSLLTSLGYEGYMTINDMGEARGCHAAGVIILGGQKYLVDVSVSLPHAFAFYSDSRANLNGPWLSYTVRPQARNVYSVEPFPHPRPSIFTLRDTPIAAPLYEQAVEQDYGPAGNFLNRVAINKVVDERAWLFNSDVRPYRLEAIDRCGRHAMPLNPEGLAQALADCYQMPAAKISAALSWVQAPQGARENQRPALPLFLEARAA